METNDVRSTWGRPDRFAEVFPELAPLAPVADEIRFLQVEPLPPTGVAEGVKKLKGQVSGFVENRELAKQVWAEFRPPVMDPTYEVMMERLHDMRTTGRAQSAAVEKLESYGFEVDPDTGTVRLPNGERGPNPSVVTLAACLVLDTMGLEPTDEVNNEVGEAVAERLRRAFLIPDLDGTDESFKKALRRHLVDPTRYRLAQRRR